MTNQDIDAVRDLTKNEQVLPKRKEFALEGYRCAVVYIVKSGFGICYKLLPNGKRQILNVILAGDVMGLPAAFFDRSPCSITSLTPMIASAVPLGRFLEFCYANPVLGFAVVSQLWEQKHIRVADHLISVGRRTPPERLAHFILEIYARLLDIGHAKGHRFELPLSQETVGDILGLSGPHVNRVLRYLKETNLVTVDHHIIEINDVAGLKILAKFEYPHLDRAWQLQTALNGEHHFVHLDENRSSRRDAFMTPNAHRDAFYADALARMRTTRAHKLPPDTSA